MPNTGDTEKQAMVMNDSDRKVDYVLEYLYSQASTLSNAHEKLGIPLDDMFANAVKKALALRHVDSHQPSLFKE